MNVNEFAKKAYKRYVAAGMTPEGACGLIGNQYAESDGFVANRVEYLCLKRLMESGQNYTQQSYTKAIDDGIMSTEQFLHPLPGKQYGYGISQWTTPERKAGLIRMTKCRGLSIADEDAQIEYTLKELDELFPNLFLYLKMTRKIDEASDRVLIEYESPANPSALKSSRREYARGMYAEMTKEERKITAEQALDVMRSWIGMDRAKGTHKQIIDLYNAHRPLARGYAVTMQDSFCDATVSAAFIKLNATDMIGGTECGVEEHIQLFKKKGIWKEDGRLKPEPGWIITYNWDSKVQPNDGYADHIGIVEEVKDGMITAVEGNIGGKVGRRVISVGHPHIRGYAIPAYAEGEFYIKLKKQFLLKRNAEKRIRQLEAFGVIGAKVIINESNNRYIVLVGKYETKQQAKEVVTNLAKGKFKGIIF